MADKLQDLFAQRKTAWQELRRLDDECYARAKHVFAPGTRVRKGPNTMVVQELAMPVYADNIGTLVLRDCATGQLCYLDLPDQMPEIV